MFALLGQVILMEDALIDVAAAIMSDSQALVEAHAGDAEGRAALEQLAAIPHGPRPRLDASPGERPRDDARANC
jgi:hypothetical protein